MRKEAKINQQANVSDIQGYHAHGYGESYAFAGFNGNWYLNSDRCIALTPNYMRNDGQPMRGYGLEIETECRGIENPTVLAEVMQKVIFPNFKFGNKMFKMQDDGSLGGDTSVEVITQVMTKGRIRNDYAAYKTMFDTYFNAFGISADAYTTSCGMHVNVSNAVFGDTKEKAEDAIRKLYYVVNKFHKFFAKLFYRNPANTLWCGQMTEDHLYHNEYANREYARKYAWQNARNLPFGNDMPSSHHNCINLSHYNSGRVEIRLVGGQRNYYTFRNTMECVFFLTENIRKVKWDDLDDLTKVFKGCNQYVCKRLLDCIGYDGFTMDMYHTIESKAITEDLELHNH